MPQLVANAEYLDRLSELAAQVGAEHIELVLVDDLESAERRFHARIDDPLWAEHQRVAAMVIEESGGYAHQYARLVRCLAGRGSIQVRSPPATRTTPTGPSSSTCEAAGRRGSPS